MSYGEEQITYYYKDLKTETGRLGNPMEHTLCFDHDNSWKYEMEEFYDAVAGKRPVHEGTITDALHLMKMVGRIYHNSGPG